MNTTTNLYKMKISESFFIVFSLLFDVWALAIGILIIIASYRPNSLLIIGLCLLASTFLSKALKNALTKASDYVVLSVNQDGVRVINTLSGADLFSCTYEYLKSIEAKRLLGNSTVVMKTTYGKSYRLSVGDSDISEEICKKALKLKGAYPFMDVV